MRPVRRRVSFLGPVSVGSALRARPSGSGCFALGSPSGPLRAPVFATFALFAAENREQLRATKPMPACRQRFGVFPIGGSLPNYDTTNDTGNHTTNNTGNNTRNLLAISVFRGSSNTGSNTYYDTGNDMESRTPIINNNNSQNTFLGGQALTRTHDPPSPKSIYLNPSPHARARRHVRARWLR